MKHTRDFYLARGASDFRYGIPCPSSLTYPSSAVRLGWLDAWAADQIVTALEAAIKETQ